MKKIYTMSPVTDTPFIEPALIQDRRSLSASLRCGRHPVSDVTAAFAIAPIDSSPTGEVAICAPATLRLAKDLFERWNEALGSGNSQRVSRRYAEDAVLLPTVSIEYVPARYTFVYENRDGEWLIAHHHSSLKP